MLKGTTYTNLHFWYNVYAKNLPLKVSSQNCKFYVGFEKDVEYNIDADFKKYTTKKWIYMYITKHN